MNLKEPEQTNTEILSKLWDDQNEVERFEKLLEDNNEADLSTPENAKGFVFAFLQALTRQVAEASSRIVTMYRILYSHRKMVEKHNVKVEYPDGIEAEADKLFDIVESLTNTIDQEAINRFIQSERNTNEQTTQTK